MWSHASALLLRGIGDCPNFRGRRGEAVVGENGTVPFSAAMVCRRGYTCAAWRNGVRLFQGGDAT